MIRNNKSNTMETARPKFVLPADERIWTLKPEVLLARGKCDLQGKEEKAIRGAIKDAISTYRKETVSLGENNMEERKQLVQLLAKSSEEAEEILIRRCTYDPAKVHKYRGKDAQDISENIDEEIAFLKNVLNELSNKRKQRTQTLLDQQRFLASMQVNHEMRDDQFPDEEQRCRTLECQLEKINQKMAVTTNVTDKYHDFVDKLNREKVVYEARLNKLQKCIEQDMRDLETCHDIMMKGHILRHDAAVKLDDRETTYVAEKKERENDIKSIRREVQRKEELPVRKKATLAEVDLDKVLKEHQNMFSQMQERRKTMAEVDNWELDYEQLQDVTRAKDAAGVTKQFERQAARHTYLQSERERVETRRRQQLQLLSDKETVLSSVRHTGAEAMVDLDAQLEQLEQKVRAERARGDAADQRLKATGATVSSARSSVRQQLRSLKFVSRPQGWSRPAGQNEIAGDMELLRFKMISLQQRYEALGAPLRLSSQDSIQSTALVASRNQYRVNRRTRTALLAAEMGKVDDMDGMRTEMKNMSQEFVIKMTTKGRRPSK